MEDIISKELLGEVLGREVKKDMISINQNNVTFAYADEDMWSDINIYELAHKCKEWAKSNLFVYMNKGKPLSETRAALDFRTKFNFGIWRGYSCCVVTIDERYFTIHTTKCFDTETEAIFKACQWVLEKENR